MIRNIAPLFPLPGFWSGSATAEVVFEFNGQQFALRHLYDNVLFRTRPYSIERTLFLTQKMACVITAASYPEVMFAAYCRSRQYGRMLVYSSSKARDSRMALFLRPDGSGFFQEEAGYSGEKQADIIEFTWNASAAGLASTGEIVDADHHALLPLCEQIFMAQVWPRMKDPFVSMEETPDEPLQFACGSQEELERVTRLICHTEPCLFAAEDRGQECYPIMYRSSCADGAGGPHPHQWNDKLSAMLRALLQLAFDYNTFTGANWRRGFYQPTRRGSYQRCPHSLTFRVLPPSAHERAEALLGLSEWLEDKVSEPERSRWLGLIGQ